jgi:nitrite reductase/ring-hydroxylating ferredoxin subunit
VVDVNGQKVLLADVDGEVFAVSNKCSHLGLPLVGKTAMFQGQIKEKCIVCPAHNTAFDLKTGAVKGEWW